MSSAPIALPSHLTPDQRRELQEALDEAEHGPWIVAPEDTAMDNWVLAFGRDHEGKTWALTTDHLHASEVKGNGPKADATAAALARNFAPLLLRETAQLRAILEKLASEDSRAALVLRQADALRQAFTRMDWLHELQDAAQLQDGLAFDAIASELRAQLLRFGFTLTKARPNQDERDHADDSATLAAVMSNLARSEGAHGDCTRVDELFGLPACTACNAKRELDQIRRRYRGPRYDVSRNSKAQAPVRR